MCLPRGQAKGCWFVSSEKVQSIKVVRKDCIRPNLGNLCRQRVAKCLAIFMRSTWPSKRLAAEKWPPRLQPPLRVSLCDGSPDLWDGQPLPPEDGGRCCRGVPRPGPRLAQGGVVCRTPTDRACRRCRTWPGKKHNECIGPKGLSTTFLLCFCLATRICWPCYFFATNERCVRVTQLCRCR